VTLIISNCSKRKRGSLDPSLHAAALAVGSAASVAAEWGERLRTADPATPAKNLYAGRAFNDATSTAAALGARLAIVSAGLGLVDGSTLAPCYSLTTARRDPDNILTKTDSSPSEWWMSLQAHSPFHSTSVDEEEGLILAALSSSYVDMVADEWSQWPEERKARLRLFTKEQPRRVADDLRQAWMPYDDRLDSIGNGHAGTQSDFAQRALRHFAATIGDRGELDQDRNAVERSLEGLAVREVPIRVRRSDKEIQSMIIAEWDAVDGRSAAMLRHLRDTLGVACEQSRFKDLFNSVAAQKKQEGVR
jgi:hypothetical protein